MRKTSAGGFQLFKRPVARLAECGALFVSSLNGDTRFRIVARSPGMRFALDGDSQINFARRIVCIRQTKTRTATANGHPRSSIGTRG
jgi:hypothetical protein